MSINFNNTAIRSLHQYKISKILLLFSACSTVTVSLNDIMIFSQYNYGDMKFLSPTLLTCHIAPNFCGQ